jgi:hypothetical protein
MTVAAWEFCLSLTTISPGTLLVIMSGRRCCGMVAFRPSISGSGCAFRPAFELGPETFDPFAVEAPPLAVVCHPKEESSRKPANVVAARETSRMITDARRMVVGVFIRIGFLSGRRFSYERGAAQN